MAQTRGETISARRVPAQIGDVLVCLRRVYACGACTAAPHGVAGCGVGAGRSGHGPRTGAARRRHSTGPGGVCGPAPRPSPLSVRGPRPARPARPAPSTRVVEISGGSTTTPTNGPQVRPIHRTSTTRATVARRSVDRPDGWTGTGASASRGWVWPPWSRSSPRSLRRGQDVRNGWLARGRVRDRPPAPGPPTTPNPQPTVRRRRTSAAGTRAAGPTSPASARAAPTPPRRTSRCASAGGGSSTGSVGRARTA